MAKQRQQNPPLQASPPWKRPQLLENSLSASFQQEYCRIDGSALCQCPLCDLRCNYSTFSDHLICQHSTPPFSCVKCKKSFERLGTFKIHITSHMKVRPYKCILCKCSFKRKQAILDHLRNAHDLYPFRCLQCNAEFKFQLHLKNHMKAHKPDSCQLSRAQTDPQITDMPCGSDFQEIRLWYNSEKDVYNIEKDESHQESLYENEIQAGHNEIQQESLYGNEMQAGHDTSNIQAICGNRDQSKGNERIFQTKVFPCYQCLPILHESKLSHKHRDNHIEKGFFQECGEEPPTVDSEYKVLYHQQEEADDNMSVSAVQMKGNASSENLQNSCCDMSPTIQEFPVRYSLTQLPFDHSWILDGNDEQYKCALRYEKYVVHEWMIN